MRGWMAIAMIGVALTGCTRFDYDPNQPRSWQVAYLLQTSQHSTMVDMLSIQPTPEGVSFELMTPTSDKGQVISAYILNCTNGTHTLLKQTFLDSKGKVTQQNTSPELQNFASDAVTDFHRRICQNVGTNPGF